jgi:hypothetical protein
MDRRTLLSLLTGAGVAIAGCNQSTETPTETATPTPETTPTAEPTDTPTATPTAEPTDTPTVEPPSPTEEPTAEPTDTPTADDRTRVAINEARDALGDVLDAYEAAGSPNATLLSIDVTVEFTTDELDAPLERAEDAIGRAEESATGEQVTTVARLRATTTWLRHLAEAQAAAGDAFDAYVTARDAVYAGDEAGARTAASDLEPLVDPVADALETATEAAEPGDVTVVGLSEQLFEDKNAQLRAAVRTFRLFVQQAEPTAAAIATFDSATDAYVDARYGEARSRYQDAEGDLNVANAVLSEPDLSASTIGRRTAELACACRALRDAADDLQGSAAAGRDDNRSRRERLLDDAKAKLTGCGSVLGRIPAVERVRNLD